MKTTPILTALAALSVASTTSFAQDYVTHGNTQRTTIATAPYGNAHPTINAVAPALGDLRQVGTANAQVLRPALQRAYGAVGGYIRVGPNTLSEGTQQNCNYLGGNGGPIRVCW
jgi:hypothetical protein